MTVCRNTFCRGANAVGKKGSFIQLVFCFLSAKYLRFEYHSFFVLAPSWTFLAILAPRSSIRLTFFLLTIIPSPHLCFIFFFIPPCFLPLGRKSLRPSSPPPPSSPSQRIIYPGSDGPFFSCSCDCCCLSCCCCCSSCCCCLGLTRNSGKCDKRI